MAVDLSRYLNRQKKNYNQVYSDILNKKYDAGWIDYVFPRMENQCDSPRSYGLGLKNDKEIKSFWETKFLKNNYIEMLKLLDKYSVKEYNSIISERGRFKISQSLNIFKNISEGRDKQLITNFLEVKGELTND